MTTKPVILTDLDDTLFQTKRKMTQEQDLTPFRTGALDRTLQPRSFMTEEQAMLTDWLLAYADLIPVTARGTEELRRVTVPFRSYAITTHGAVILQPDGSPEPVWQSQMLAALAPYRERLLSLQQFCTDLMAERGIEAWARINYEYDDVPVYLVMKHTDSTRTDELYAVAAEIEQQFPSDGFYIHRNSNNIAWLPDPVEKGLAVTRLLTLLRAERGTFPVIGLGDSLSDYRFMKHCTWFGMPSRSQFADAVAARIFSEVSDV